MIYDPSSTDEYTGGHDNGRSPFHGIVVVVVRFGRMIVRPVHRRRSRRRHRRHCVCQENPQCEREH